MQMTQLSIYSTNVPKLDASTIMVRSDLGRPPSGREWWRTTRLTRAHAASVAIARSAIAEESPNTISSAMQPMTAEMPASVQIAR